MRPREALAQKLWDAARASKQAVGDADTGEQRVRTGERWPGRAGARWG